MSRWPVTNSRVTDAASATLTKQSTPTAIFLNPIEIIESSSYAWVPTATQRSHVWERIRMNGFPTRLDTSFEPRAI